MTDAATPAITRFEQLLAAGKDGALLRFALGQEYLKLGDAARASMHLRQAVAFDAGYSAAWKLLGQSLGAEGRTDEALAAYRNGIAAADRWRTAFTVSPPIDGTRMPDSRRAVASPLRETPATHASPCNLKQCLRCAMRLRCRASPVRCGAPGLRP
jgi:tetratricopeptide (TPR) repeat protein